MIESRLHLDDEPSSGDVSTAIPYKQTNSTSNQYMYHKLRILTLGKGCQSEKSTYEYIKQLSSSPSLD